MAIIKQAVIAARFIININFFLALAGAWWEADRYFSEPGVIKTRYAR